MIAKRHNGRDRTLIGAAVIVALALIGYTVNGFVRRADMHEKRIELLEESLKETIRLEGANVGHFANIDERLNRIEAELRELRIELARSSKD